ncbi:MAG: M28 family peptidase [Planctomycetes bacterium]|nr:M28 family peptidase [Planctomycetota bacterium]
MSTVLVSKRHAVGVFWLALASCVSPVGAQSADSARDRITRADLEGQVRFLASDELRGRRTGAPEAVLAANWLAKELEKCGVSPAGDAGTYLQRVPMNLVERHSVPRITATTRSGETRELAYGVDFDQIDVLNDLAIEHVVVITRKEDFPPHAAKTVALVLPEAREERNALLTAAGTPNGAGWGLLLTLGPDTAGKPREFSPSTSGPAVDDGVQRLRLRGDWKKRALAGELTQLSVVANATLTPVEAFNVVGVLAGRGPKAEQAVVVSAHYDHLGVASKPPKEAPGEPASGESPDVIFNGADDDASGCAVVLELADALAHSAPPDRTTIFFFATGEELGLLGTNWYVDHPFVPLEKTVLNLNFEMLGRPDALAGGPGKLWLTGDERSNLGETFRARGVPVVADPRPDQNFFMRSDNMAFVRRGIVGQSLSTYDLHQDYHHVTDEADTLDYVHLETCARTAFDALSIVVDDAFDPQWSPGQKFER